MANPPQTIEWKLLEGKGREGALPEEQVPAEAYARLAGNFGIVSGSYDAHNRDDAGLDNRINDRVLEILSNAFGGDPIKVLAMGCGPGTVEYSILSRYPGAGKDLSNVEAHGVDLSRRMLDLAQQRGFRVHLQDMTMGLPADGPQAYDAILWMGSFIHVLYPGLEPREAQKRRASILQECYAGLTPGGHLALELFYDPGAGCAYEYFRYPVIDGVPHEELKLSFFLRSFSLPEIAHIGRLAGIPESDIQLYFTDRKGTEEGELYHTLTEALRDVPKTYRRGTSIVLDIAKP